MTKYGFCHCGCGLKTRIAHRTRKDYGWVRGEPLEYINGHLSWNHTEKAKQKMRIAKTGERNPNWKGSNALPNAGNQRAERLFKIGKCENCEKKATDRHHKDGNTLNNDPDNVKHLCRLCHLIEDGRLKTLHKNYQLKVRGKQTHDPLGRFLPFKQDEERSFDNGNSAFK